jgi:hypothetical protein
MVREVAEQARSTMVLLLIAVSLTVWAATRCTPGVTFRNGGL